MNKDKIFKVLAIIAVLFFAYKIMPLLIIVVIAFLFMRKKSKPKDTPPKREIPVEKPVADISAIQAGLEECNKVINDKNSIIAETDLRQFKGRSDVTRDELLQYMFEQRFWDGVYERRIQMEEIIKHCNLTMEDVDYCMDNLNHYQTDGMTVKACVVRSDEAKAIWQETNNINKTELEKTIAYRNKVNNQVLDILHNDNENGLDDLFPTDCSNDYDNEVRRYDYDTWIERKGAI